MNRLYSPRKGDKITITKEDQKIIEELEANVQISGYYDYMVVWSKEDNDISYEDIMLKMQMISMTSTPKLDKDKYKFYDVHYKLLRRLYLEEDHSDGCVTMGYKRPFGNSVEGDVRVFLIDLKLKKGANDDEDYDEDYTMENEVLKEFAVFITDFYKGGYELLTPEFDALDAEFPSFIAREETKKRFKEIGLNDEYLHSYLENWVPSLSAMRDKKLEDLGIN